MTSVTLHDGAAGVEDAPVIRRRAPGASVFVVAMVVLAVTAGGAWAQSASPSPARGPSVSGQVTGALSAGSRLVIRVDATMPGG